MPETQRQSVPFVDTGELDTALAFLDFARQCALKKAEGLSDEQVRRVVVDSGTSLLGLIHHLAVSERYWFGYHLVGSEFDDSWDFEMTIPGDRSTQQVIDGYVAAIGASNEAIRSATGPDQQTARPVGDERQTLRWVLAHMTSETARHVGHADIIREQIDGVTGR